MLEKKIRGIATALITPFKDGAIDEQALKDLIIRQLDNHISFLVPLGTTAETPCLSKEEKLKVMDIVSTLAPDVPLVVGVGSNSIAGTLANIELVKNYNIAAYLVVVPFYNKPTQEGLYQYFKHIAENCGGKDIILYNVPGRTGCNMCAETTLRLAHDVKNIVGIKEASGNKEQMKAIIDAAPKDFCVLSGNDDELYDVLKMGADGMISVASNLCPRIQMMIYTNFVHGNTQASKEYFDMLAPLYEACFIESNPIPTKAGLAYWGYCTDELRLPLTKAKPETAKKMAEILENLYNIENLD